jgi:hypothetical protein
VAITGKSSSSASKVTPKTRYGTTDRKMWAVVTSGGAPPRMVMSRRPCGGRRRHSCMQIRNSTHQTRLDRCRAASPAA